MRSLSCLLNNNNTHFLSSSAVVVVGRRSLAFHHPTTKTTIIGCCDPKNIIINNSKRLSFLSSAFIHQHQHRRGFSRHHKFFDDNNNDRNYNPSRSSPRSSSHYDCADDEDKEELAGRFRLDHHQEQQPIVKPQFFDYFLILDLEATCDGPTKPAIFPKEIIEFPCLKVNSRTMEVESQFHRYVRPLHNPTLSDHCVELTGIIQEMIDEQPEFLSVLCDFNQWMVDEELYVPKRQNSESKGGHDKPKYSSVFCTFGDWDLNVMIPEQCALTGVMTPTYFNRWANIKKTMSSTLKQWPHSFAQMLDKLNLTHEGRAHSGMDDCRNTVNALRQLIVTHGGQVKITTIRNLKHGAAGNSTAPSASVQSNDAENELVMIKKSARYIE